MKNKNEKTLLNIQLFAENGIAENGNTSGENTGSDDDCKQNENDSFESLIGGKYKEEFSRKTQEIIDKRFKKTKELEAYFNNVSPIINKLSNSLGVNSEDYDGMLNSFNEEEKSEKDEEFTEDERLDEIRNKLHEMTVGFIDEGEKLKELYPDFDLKKELSESNLFSKLIKNGVSLKDAFETVHKDELISGAMAYTANAVKEQMLMGIEKKSSRPIENGIGDKSAAVTKTNVNALTRNDILKILKQVENGAQIRF